MSPFFSASVVSRSPVLTRRAVKYGNEMRAQMIYTSDFAIHSPPKLTFRTCCTKAIFAPTFCVNHARGSRSGVSVFRAHRLPHVNCNSSTDTDTLPRSDSLFCSFRQCRASCLGARISFVKTTSGDSLYISVYNKHITLSARISLRRALVSPSEEPPCLQRNALLLKFVYIGNAKTKRAALGCARPDANS